MAGMTFTLAGVPFAAMSSANGKYAKAFTPAPVYSIIQYKIFGAKGQLTCDGDLVCWHIRALVRYVSLAPYTDMNTDVTAMARPGAGSTTGPNGTVYTRCRLEANGARVVRDAVSMGRGVAGQQFMDVEYTLISDGG